MRPAQRRAGVGQVNEQRQQVRFIAGLHRQVILFHRGRVDIAGDGFDAAARKLAAEQPVVGAQVPGAARFNLLREAADQRALGLERFICVISEAVIRAPFGSARLPGERQDGFFQPVEDVQQRRLAQFHRRGLGGLPVAVLPLRPGVQVQVHRQPAEPQPGLARQQHAGQIQRNAVQVNAQELGQADIHHRSQRQGRQEVLAELTVGVPGGALLVEVEGERIDEQRFSIDELDIVRAGVFEHHTVFQRGARAGQRQQRGVFELRETPLIRVRNEGHLFRADDPVSQRGVSSGRVYLFVPDQHTLQGERVINTSAHQFFIRLLVSFIHLAV